MNDHRDLARVMDLFHFEEHSPGMVFWHPHGLRVFQQIEHFMRQLYQAHGFEEVRSPLALSRQLWERSGHWEKFHDNIFVVGSLDADKDGAALQPDYALKPMSCPAHIAIYNARPRSYREMPLRFMEFGIVHRNEPSGTLSGCLRLRQFVQDDAHIFCREAAMGHEIRNFLSLIQSVYSAFGFDQFMLHVALRPEQRLGSDAVWDRAEAALMDACQALGYDYQISPGEGAFYGPKIEVSLRDYRGRSWQCGTFQIDFNLPRVFDLAFVNEEGELERPVMLHQAVLGSLERWLGILLEHYHGILPLWLAPVQVAIASISEKSVGWAERVYHQLKQQGVRVELDVSDRTINKKVRNLVQQRVPFIAVVGEQEAERQLINLRRLGNSQQQEMSVEYLLNELNLALNVRASAMH